MLSSPEIIGVSAVIGAIIISVAISLVFAMQLEGSSVVGVVLAIVVGSMLVGLAAWAGARISLQRTVPSVVTAPTAATPVSKPTLTRTLVAPTPTATATRTPTRVGADASKTVTIPGTQLWVDTGLTVSPGDEISIEASGTIIYGDPHNEANTAGPEGKEDVVYSGHLVLGVRRHSLVGNIADSPSLDGKGFFVGSSFRGVVPIASTTKQSGKLFLSFNDDCINEDRSGYNAYCWTGDNHGSFTATIAIVRER